jgi:hypothetical protein
LAVDGAGTITWRADDSPFTPSLSRLVPGAAAPYSVTLSAAGPVAANGAQTVVNAGSRARPMVIAWDTTAPVVSTSGPDRATAGDLVSFAATSADWSPVDTFWSFGDGGTAAGSSVTYRFPNPGTFTVTATVIDGHGYRTSVTRSIAVGARPAVAPPERLGGSVLARWRVRGSRTTVTRLRVSRLPAGAAVAITCKGGGCPFSRRTLARPRGTVVNGLKPFGKRRTLRAGARVEVQITRAGAIGRVVRYTVAKNRRPRGRVLCLAPGARSARGC